MHKLLEQLGINICFNADGGGGAGGDGGAGDGGDGGSSSAAGSDAAGSDTSVLGGDAKSDDTGDGAEGDDKNADGSDKTDGDDKSKDDKSEDGKDKEKDDKTDQDSEPLAITAPEGFEAYQEDFDKFSTDIDSWMKDNPEASTKDVLAEAARRQAQSVADQAKASADSYNEQLETWAAEARADKEIGGDNYDKNVGVAVNAINTYGTPELKTLLNESGLGNHPELIRFAMKAGQGLKEADVITGASARPQQSAADRYYNNSKS